MTEEPSERHCPTCGQIVRQTPEQAIDTWFRDPDNQAYVRGVLKAAKTGYSDYMRKRRAKPQ